MRRESTSDDIKRLEAERDEKLQQAAMFHDRSVAPKLNWDSDPYVTPTDIVVPPGRRPLDEAVIAALVEDFGRNGFHGAILCREEELGHYVLLDGGHRLEAAKRADLEYVCVNIVPPDADAEIIEHSANLLRKELSEAERKVATAKYKRSWEAHQRRLKEARANSDEAHDSEVRALTEKYGKKIAYHQKRIGRQNNGAPCAETPQVGRPQGFASHAAALTGRSKSQVNRDVADGANIISLVTSGVAKNPDEALEQIKVLQAPPPPPKPPPSIYLAADTAPPTVPPALRRLREAWDAATPDIRRQFASEIRNTDELKEAMR